MQRNVFLSAALLCSAVIVTGINAEGKSVEELKKAGDFRGLVAKVGDHRAVVRKYAERAFQHTLLKFDHEPTLTIAAHPPAAQLDSKDLHFRSYSAVMPSVVVRKIKDRDTLKSLLGRITPAATKDPDPGVRDYAGRAMHHIQHVLKEKKKPAAPEKGNPGVEASNSVDAAQHAIKADVATSKKPGNWRELAARLKDQSPAVRRQAAFALQQVVQDMTNDAELKQLIQPLVAATLNDPSAEVHKHARFALRGLLSKVEDEAALIPVAQSFLTGLNHRDPQVRAHCAHDLPGVVSKIKDEAALLRMLRPLTVATLRSESMEAVDFPGFALRDMLSRIDDPKALAHSMSSLIGGLKHKDETMRGFCIHELSGIVAKIEDEEVLKSTIGPLNAATLKAKSMDARDFAGFALRSVLRKTSDEMAVLPVIQTSLAGLKHEDSTMRTFYAHTLHENVSKVKDKTVLTRAVGPLTTASLQVTDSGNSGLSAGDLAYSALKQVLDIVDDQAALKSIVRPMAEALKAEEVKRRRYAAHAVMLFAHKVRDKVALWPLVQPLVAAHYHDADETVRRSAGLALERTFGRVPEPN